MTSWKTHEMHGGLFRLISELVRDGLRHLELHGTRDSGWQVYSLDANRVGLPVSPVFHRDLGDTRQMAIDACRRAYGVKPAIVSESL